VESVEVVPALKPTDEDGVFGASTKAVAGGGDFLISLCGFRTVGRTLALVRGSGD